MLSERLTYLRKKRKMTQSALSKALGIARTTLSGYESGTREPDHETLQKIADYFEVSIDYLLGRTEEPKKVLSESSRILVDSLNLTDEETLNKIRFEIDGKEIREEDIKEFIAYVRFKRSTNKE